MKMIKSLAAFCLAFILIFNFSSCHPKDEVAMTVGDIEITSALYMCALLQADGGAKPNRQECCPRCGKYRLF